MPILWQHISCFIAITALLVSASSTSAAVIKIEVLTQDKRTDDIWSLGAETQSWINALICKHTNGRPCNVWVPSTVSTRTTLAINANIPTDTLVGNTATFSSEMMKTQDLLRGAAMLITASFISCEVPMDSSMSITEPNALVCAGEKINNKSTDASTAYISYGSNNKRLCKFETNNTPCMKPQEFIPVTEF